MFTLKLFFRSLSGILFSGILLTLSAAEIQGIPRDSNFNNTSGYDSTRVHAQLLLNVKEKTRTVHFIRDNNDPRVVTKTYLLRHVDPYEIRDYLRQMVQSKRVGNTSLQQNYPGNTSNPNMGTVSSAGAVTPPNTQNTYTPPLQLGSNTAVECLKYADGTALLIISAEEYRFKDHPNGMGFDSLVAFLDKPQMGSSLGTQTFFYIPKYVPARNLMSMIQNVGMNITDVTEIWQGMDVVAYDPDLNYLIFDTANYSMANIEKMLEQYDVPIPQVKVRIRVYELNSENDTSMGVDFQAWKNNGGLDFFSAGGRFRDNWGAAYNSNLMQSGSERTSFYNFNPKWNTRYLDLLTAYGNAEILHTGELTIRNNTPSTLERTTQVFYCDTSAQAPGSSTTPDWGSGPYRLLSLLTDRIFPRNDYPVAKDNVSKIVRSTPFGFTMKITNASVNLKETRFSLVLQNSSLIGFESTGAPRISPGTKVELTVSLPHGKNEFVIGGLRKVSRVTSRTGIPFLCRIPILEYIFGTVSTSLKSSELIVVGQCEYDAVREKGSAKARSKAYTL